MKINKIHVLNTVFLLFGINIFSSAIEYYFNEIVGLENGIWEVECLKNKFDNKTGESLNLCSKIISRNL